MSQMNLAQARVADPILTTVARGFVSPKSPIANVLFPRVQVQSRAGHILSFRPEDFVVINTARAPGSDILQVQFGYGSEKYSLVDRALEGLLPVEIEEESAAVPGVDMSTVTVRRVLNIMAIEREAQAAALATNTSNYANGHSDTLGNGEYWSDPDSSPAEQIDDAKEVVRSKIGAYPNTLALSPSAWRCLRNHPKLLDRISTSKDRVPLTRDQLAALLEVDQIVVGDGVTYDDANAKFVDLWGQDAVLAYTTPASAAEMGSPNFGYTYGLGEGPNVAEPRWIAGKRSWAFQTWDAYQAVLAGAVAGFLFKGVVEP